MANPTVYRYQNMEWNVARYNFSSNHVSSVLKTKKYFLKFLFTMYMAMNEIQLGSHRSLWACEDWVSTAAYQYKVYVGYGTLDKTT